MYVDTHIMKIQNTFISRVLADIVSICNTYVCQLQTFSVKNNVIIIMMDKVLGPLKYIFV